VPRALEEIPAGSDPCDGAADAARTHDQDPHLRPPDQ
jgi:hypothetical protein